MTYLVKDPKATLDYGFDWTAWLDGDAIGTSEWAVPAGLTVTNQAYSSTGTVVWLRGGVAGVEYPITNTITTSGGRTDARTMRIIVRGKGE